MHHTCRDNQHHKPPTPHATGIIKSPNTLTNLRASRACGAVESAPTPIICCIDPFPPSTDAAKCVKIAAISTPCRYCSGIETKTAIPRTTASTGRGKGVGRLSMRLSNAMTGSRFSSTIPKICRCSSNVDSRACWLMMVSTSRWIWL